SLPVRRGSGPVKCRLVGGEKRLCTFGSLPVRGGSGPVKCRLPPVPGRVADSCRCCALVYAGDALVRLGCVAERLRAGGPHLRGGGGCLGPMPLGRFQPLARGTGPVLTGVQVPLRELLQPGADGVKPDAYLALTAWRQPGLAARPS